MPCLSMEDLEELFVDILNFVTKLWGFFVVMIGCFFSAAFSIVFHFDGASRKSMALGLCGIGQGADDCVQGLLE